MTSLFSDFILVGEGVPEIFEPSEKTPALYLREMKIGNKVYIYAIPEDVESGVARGYCFGGNFIHSSDSRFPNDYPIPVHDRRE